MWARLTEWLQNLYLCLAYFAFVDIQWHCISIKNWGGWTRTNNLRGNNPVRLPVAPHPIWFLKRYLFVTERVVGLLLWSRLRFTSTVFNSVQKLYVACHNLCSLALVALFVLV